MNRFDKIDFFRPQIQTMTGLDLVIYDLVWLGVNFIADFFHSIPFLSVLMVCIKVYAVVMIIITTVKFFSRNHSSNPKPAHLPKDQKASAKPSGTPSGMNRFRGIQPDYPFYDQALDKLQQNTDTAHERAKAISEILDDYFDGSQITKSRYMDIVSTAVESIETAQAKCERAINLFGRKKAPTPDRMKIVNGYVESSDKILGRMEKVITELIALEQKETFEDSQELEDSLNMLASTTSLYTH